MNETQVYIVRYKYVSNPENKMNLVTLTFEERDRIEAALQKLVDKGYLEYANVRHGMACDFTNFGCVLGQIWAGAERAGLMTFEEMTV